MSPLFLRISMRLHQRWFIVWALVQLLGISVASAAAYYATDYSGATVFRDRNLNGEVDEGEPTIKTEPDGRFPAAAVRGKGRLSLIDGFDLATQRPNTRLLTAPSGARAINTLTALWQALQRRGKAGSRIRKLLFVPRSVSVGQLTAGLYSKTRPNSKAEAILKRNAQHKTLVQFLSGLARAATQAKSNQQGQRAAGAHGKEDDSIAALADTLAALDPGQSVNITDSERVSQILGTSLANLGITVGVEIKPEDLQLVSVVAATSINAEIEKTSSAQPDVFDGIEQQVGKGSDYLDLADFAGFKAYFFPAPKFTAMSDDTGSSTTDRVTRDVSPTFLGIAPPQAVRLRVYRDGEQADEVIPDVEGKWSYTSANLGNGLHTFGVTGVTAFGYEGMISATMPVTVDIIPPARPTVTPLNTTSATPTLHGQWSADATNTVSVSVNGKSYTTANGLALDADGWHLTLPKADALPKTGAYEVTVTETDPAGNWSTDTSLNELKLIITIPAPVITSVGDDTGSSGSDGITRDTTPTLAGTVDASSVAVNVYRDSILIGKATPVSGQWSFTDAELPDGKYRYSSAGVNAAGEPGIVSEIAMVTVDTASPATPTVAALQTGSLRPTLTGTWSQAPGDNLSVIVNGNAYTAANGLSATTTTWSLHLPPGAGLNPGKWDVTARVSDLAGNAATDDATHNELTVSMFGAATAATTGYHSYGIAAGDFNRDGKTDLATVGVDSKFGSIVSVLLSNGDGTFQTHVDYPVGVGATAIAAADLHGDGRVDLITANAGNNNVDPPVAASVTVLIGVGDGSFVDQASENPVGTWANFVAVGDLNGDGRPDVVTANYGVPYLDPPVPGGVSVLINSNNGWLESAVNYSVDNHPQTISLGDLNGDGKTDLAITTLNGQGLVMLPGKGDGTFSNAVDYPLGMATAATVFTDLDDDDKPDVAVAARDDTVRILLGKDGGKPEAQLRAPAGRSPQSIVMADFNADGRSDLATANQTGNSVSLLLGNGDGSFKLKADYPVGTQPTGLVVMDVNGDGRPDLATSNHNGSNVSVLLNTAEGGFPGRYDYPNADPRTLALGELDGDDKLDAAIVTDQGITVRLGDGAGDWKSSIQYSTSASPRAVSITDFNADGLADLAVSRSDHVNLLLGIGSGVFAPYVDYPVGIAVASLVGDCDGDGLADVVTVNYGDTAIVPPVPPHLGVLLGHGDGTLAASIDTIAGNQPLVLAAGDFNGDGRLDVATTDAGDPEGTPAVPGTISVLLGKGDGSFQDKVDYPVGDIHAPRAIVAADFNRDGKLDLAGANYWPDTVSLLLGKGDGTFSAPTDFGVGRRPYDLAVADLNGDGNPDLASISNRDNTLSVLYGNGRGGFHPRLDLPTGVGPTSVEAGDLNGDGRPDLVVTNRTALSISVLLNNLP
ncbi:MAG: VCBS repeat-containing protein [Methylococcaceae bacterium]|nr:VCBS repeat-containing protein [Methylococcaceae bacterium]